MSSLKNKLKNKKLTIGSWITIPSMEIAEILCDAGFEWLVIDLEHTTIDLNQAKNLISTIQGKGKKSLVRVSKNEEVIIKRVLDFGADGIIVPMVKNREDAVKAVSFTQYPPNGSRGVGLSRAQKYGVDFDGYKTWLKNEMIVIAQIEHIESVKNINEILNVDGIDGTLIGPYDLSASMGLPGQYETKKVKNCLAKVEKEILKSEKSLGFHVIESNHLNSLKKIEKGYNFIAFSIDFFFLGDYARNQLNQLKNQIK